MATQALTLDIRNTRYFPGVFDIPNDGDAHPEFFDVVSRDSMLPRRRWCLLVEIKMHSEGTLRPTYEVKGVAGDEFRVAFYVGAPEFPTIVDHCQPGYTLAIMFAARNACIDDKLLIPVRTLREDIIQVLPCGIKEVYSISDKMNSPTLCAACRKPSSLKCGRCGLPFCDAVCMKENWKVEHKRQCVVAQKLREWSALDWEKF
ncbi:hypothetical protein BDN72DRAFT_842171 [Pluteus cervinus]|uniref:Uncharacterized protein n=1 Tax=Pluteus cervinus TaxID=181527 RepID=A0ACD3AQT4_9AGAR|nr:hypothetical protein BDN72DRAFT_842171 [Pluteus cervinus]